MGRINQRLNGLNPLSYLGENSYQPPEFVTDNRAPAATDVQNFQLGTIWLNITNNPPGAEDVWMLVSQYGGSATWVNFAGGALALETLTGNSGGAVSGDVNDNINVLGDTTTITVVGNPGTNTLTISTVGTGVVSTLTGNSGGAVSPLAGNTNIVGSGVITVVGNPGTHTLTITPSGAIASSFPTDSGTATPSSGVLNVLGGTAGRDINTSGSGNTIHIDLKNAITLGDLSAIAANSNAISCTTGDINIAAGNLKLPAFNTAGTQGVIKFGSTVGLTNNGIDNAWGGVTQPPFSTLSGTNNFSFGGANMPILTTGSNNITMGGGILTLGTTANGNACLGMTILGTATSAGGNIAVGTTVLGSLLTGVSNIAIGNGAGSGYTGAEGSNIIIGTSTGTAAESNVIRIGSTSTKCFIQGIRGITTGVNDAVAVLVDSANQLGTVSSSIRFKENVEDMADHSAALMKLRPVVFNYKDDMDHNLQTGLIAEEVLEVMPKLVVHGEDGLPLTIKYHDLGPLLLNELQKLAKRVKELESKLSNCCKE